MTTELTTTMLDTYRRELGGLDELATPTGIRNHWHSLATALETLGPEELTRRQLDVERLLDADGVTYRNLESGQAQPWSLDAIPLLMSSDEWAVIEAGVTQRAVLLDLVLRDLYGERMLLRRGVIPPALVFDHPGFLRPWDGVALADHSQLFSYGVDLARSADGSFQVLGDHAQAPSGAGYALENRMVLSRVFPSIYRDVQVHHVSPYFRSLRSGLQQLGGHHSDDPRIVVLSPGARSETAFEHAYLASYLGYSLVEGDDLVVQGGHVYLRSLGHLEKVDVILRRVDAGYCDPLELRPESQLGIPGLVEACRRGNVTVVNPLGSGVIENPALHCFLEAASKALLGQDLLLPGMATWWCGEPSSRQFVLDHLEELVCKPVSRETSSRSHFGSTMSKAELSQLRKRIEAEPHRWVGQEPLAMSTTPTLTATGVAPRRTLLRTYAVAREDSFTVMSGGLTRVAPDETTPLISNQFGALSKDTWVLASVPQRQTEFWLRSGPAIGADDPMAGLSERAAENLYWIGRYAERAEAVARLLRAVHDRRNNLTLVDTDGQDTIDALLRALTITTFAWPGFVGDNADELLANPDRELFSLTCDAQRPGSLAYAVARLLRSAEAVRDQLSIDTWQVTSTLEKQLYTLSTTSPNRQDVVQGTLGVVLQSLLALHGLIGESMVRDAGWHFLESGRRIERFQQLVRLLRATLDRDHDTATESLLLESVLVSAESIITYRRRYRSRAQVETLLDLLVTDAGNPRSLRFQVDRLESALAALPGNVSGALTAEERHLLPLSTQLRVAHFAELAEPNELGNRAALFDFLTDLEDRINDVANALSNRSFVHLQPRRSLTEVDGGETTINRHLGEGAPMPSTGGGQSQSSAGGRSQSTEGGR
ncbi:MAG: circularly permuted type 2 ATP-grasp protein [Acidimicrobiales bacterium]